MSTQLEELKGQYLRFLDRLSIDSQRAVLVRGGQNAQDIISGLDGRLIDLEDDIAWLETGKVSRCVGLNFVNDGRIFDVRDLGAS